MNTYYKRIRVCEIEEKGNTQIHVKFYLGLKSQMLSSLCYLQHFISSPLKNTTKISRRVKRDHLVWKLYNMIFSFCSILLQQLRSVNCIIHLSYKDY